MYLTRLLPSTQGSKAPSPQPLGGTGQASKEKDSTGSGGNQSVPHRRKSESGSDDFLEYTRAAGMPLCRSTTDPPEDRPSPAHQKNVCGTHPTRQRATRRSSCGSLDVSDSRYIEGPSARASPHFLERGACLSRRSYVRSKSRSFLCCWYSCSFGS